MTIKGIDVSNYQPDSPSLAGMSFCFVKATEGVTYVNPRHAAQVAHARAAGVVVGHYHFVNGNSSMADQVAFFVRQAGARAGEILALDWETSSVSSAEKDDFLKTLKAAAPGHKVILYCNSDYWLHRDASSYAADGLWIAEYNGRPGQPDIKARWVMHQYTSTPIDTSLANFSSQQAMAVWAGAAEPTPAPARRTVSLAHVVYAAKHDPSAPQGHTSYRADVLLVEKALNAEGLLLSKYVDGSFGTKSVNAYAALQRRYGYSGTDANGIPGMPSLTRLGQKHGFTVTS